MSIPPHSVAAATTRGDVFGFRQVGAHAAAGLTRYVHLGHRAAQGLLVAGRDHHPRALLREPAGNGAADAAAAAGNHRDLSGEDAPAWLAQRSS